MGTKLNPGKFDCHASAGADEPLFTLLARDPLAPFLTSIWAAVRAGDFEMAEAVFTGMMRRVAGQYYDDPDMDKSGEALTCSAEMFQWKKVYDAASAEQQRRMKTPDRRSLSGVRPPRYPLPTPRCNVRACAGTSAVACWLGPSRCSRYKA